MASTVLDGWHTLEDLARAVDCAAHCSRDAEMRDIYDSLFYAATIPELQYGPQKPTLRLDIGEIAKLRERLLGAWQIVSDKTSQIPPPPRSAMPAEDTPSLRRIA